MPLPSPSPPLPATRGDETLGELRRDLLSPGSASGAGRVIPRYVALRRIPRDYSGKTSHGNVCRIALAAAPPLDPAGGRHVLCRASCGGREARRRGDLGGSVGKQLLLRDPSCRATSLPRARGIAWGGGQRTEGASLGSRGNVISQRYLPTGDWLAARYS